MSVINSVRIWRWSAISGSSRCRRRLHVPSNPAGERVPALHTSYLHRPGLPALTTDTMPMVLQRAAVDFASQEAAVFVQQNVRKTWAEMTRDAERLALAFIQLGLDPGDRVGIWATNVYEWQLTQYAAYLSGLILVVINQAYQWPELEYCLRTTGTKVLVAAEGFRSSDFYHMLSQLLPELDTGELNAPLALKSEKLPHLRSVIHISQQRKPGVVRFDDVLGAADEANMAKLRCRQELITCDDPLNIQLTSGTTGLPKGAVWSHHQIVNNMIYFGRRIGVQPGDERICVPIPLYHAFGSVAGPVLAAIHGATVVYPSPNFDAAATVRVAQDERCTFMYGAPTMFVDILSMPELQKYDLHSLHAGVIAGAPVPSKLMRAIVDKLGMRDAVVAYGMTEVGFLTAGLPTDDLEHRCDTVGFCLENTEVRVVDDAGRLVPPGTPGQLCTRGYNTFVGYWADEERTRQAFSPSRWFLTGDVAVMNPDGYVRIVGRAKDMVIRGGTNVYPAEVESFLHTHPGVLEAHVIGVPDRRLGEELCAWIRTDDSNITEDQIKDFCRGQIAHYKIPRYVYFRADFPKTVTGKVQKYIMREIMIKEMGLESDDPN